ncbi:MAG: hypothetical protein LBM97_01345 [Candidatus Nomurabacteria bacterium]|jgi:hypothetical protein|nr:hypothetical protein [Candidatus Nomurabacteria bacterium]
MKQRRRIIIPENIKNSVEPHEIEVAKIISTHLNTDILFLEPIDFYKVKTADFVANGLEWEIKSPIGNSKRETVRQQFRKASKQAKNIVLDGRRTKLEDDFILKQIERGLQNHRSIKKLLFITKDEKVLEIKK